MPTIEEIYLWLVSPLDISFNLRSYEGYVISPEFVCLFVMDKSGVDFLEIRKWEKYLEFIS